MPPETAGSGGQDRIPATAATIEHPPAFKCGDVTWLYECRACGAIQGPELAEVCPGCRRGSTTRTIEVQVVRYVQ